ncbi:MAG: hypothetical protein V1826_01345 [bacterium]
MKTTFEDIGQFDFEIEEEWRRVEELLAKNGNSALWSMAVIEAHKIFDQVLDEVSFGEAVDEKIHNAGELFKNINALLEADEVYRRIVNEVGYRVKRDEARRMCDALIQAILDMIGRDFETRGFWQRTFNSVNYFWGHHPKLLAGVIAGFLVFVVAVWLLADTVLGRWIVDLVVGFSRFVLSRTALVIGLVAAFVLALGLGVAYLEGRHRRE